MADQESGTLLKQKVFPTDFWKSYTLDELAAMQNVKPVKDVRSLMGGWPGDVDDGFEEAIIELRKQGQSKEQCL